MIVENKHWAHFFILVLLVLLVLFVTGTQKINLICGCYGEDNATMNLICGCYGEDNAWNNATMQCQHCQLSQETKRTSGCVYCRPVLYELKEPKKLKEPVVAFIADLFFMN